MAKVQCCHVGNAKRVELSRPYQIRALRQTIPYLSANPLPVLLL
jgi:hypothetical protein